VIGCLKRKLSFYKCRSFLLMLTASLLASTTSRYHCACQPLTHLPPSYFYIHIMIISRNPDHEPDWNQNLIDCSFGHAPPHKNFVQKSFEKSLSLDRYQLLIGPRPTYPKISSKTFHHLLSNRADRQTDRQTDKGKNIASFL